MPQIRLMLHQRVGPTRVNSSSMRVGRPRSMEAAADARSQNQTMNVSSAHRAFARKEHGGGFAAILSDSPGNKRPDALEFRLCPWLLYGVLRFDKLLMVAAKNLWCRNMALGISPTVDFAFKLMLGSPEHSGVTIHFLNAILTDQPKISHVEILNPFLGKDSDDDKLTPEDIRRLFPDEEIAEERGTSV